MDLEQFLSNMNGIFSFKFYVESEKFLNSQINLEVEKPDKPLPNLQLYSEILIINIVRL